MALIHDKENQSCGCFQNLHMCTVPLPSIVRTVASKFRPLSLYLTEMNGQAERYVIAFLVMTRALLAASGLDDNHRAFAVQHATFLNNHQLAIHWVIVHLMK